MKISLKVVVEDVFKMGTFIRCKKCNLWTVEVLGDVELGCEHCLNKEED